MQTLSSRVKLFRHLRDDVIRTENCHTCNSLIWRGPAVSLICFLMFLNFGAEVITNQSHYPDLYRLYLRHQYGFVGGLLEDAERAN